MRTLILATALLAPLPALAHPGGAHVHDLASGLLHPFGGLDHLVAMIAVGAWAGMLGGTARLLLPLGFLAGMAGGAALGVTGFGLPMVEAGILASIIVLGALIAASARMPLAAALPVVLLFGLLHGHAHGTELAGGALGYLAGMLVGTGVLHGAGVMLSRTGTTRRFGPLRAAGAASAVMAFAVLVLGSV